MDLKFQYTNLEQSTSNNDLTLTIDTTYNFATHKQLLFIQQWNNVSGFSFLVVYLVFTNKIKNKKDLTKIELENPNQIRERESNDLDQIERELSQVVHKI